MRKQPLADRCRSQLTCSAFCRFEHSAIASNDVCEPPDDFLNRFGPANISAIDLVVEHWHTRNDTKEHTACCCPDQSDKPTLQPGAPNVSLDVLSKFLETVDNNMNASRYGYALEVLACRE